MCAFCWDNCGFFCVELNVNELVSRWWYARLSRSGPGFDPRSGQVSWVRFFLTCKTNVGKLYASKVPEYHLAIIIIIIHYGHQ